MVIQGLNILPRFNLLNSLYIYIYISDSILRRKLYLYHLGMFWFQFCSLYRLFDTISSDSSGSNIPLTCSSTSSSSFSSNIVYQLYFLKLRETVEKLSTLRFQWLLDMYVQELNSLSFRDIGEKAPVPLHRYCCLLQLYACRNKWGRY